MELSEQIREWAYDEDAFLSEQDEDFLFYNESLFPLCIEIASDEACPKRGDILYWISCFISEKPFGERKRLIDKVASEIELYNSVALKSWLSELRSMKTS